MRTILLPILILPTLALSGPDPVSNSAFDFSMSFPEPGTRGRVVRDGQNLRFQYDAPGTRRVFVGTNLTGMACFPTTSLLADRWARSLRRRGYNAVRFHHIDWVIRDRGWAFKTNADRFIAALKNQDIYVTIDLFSDRVEDRNGFKRGVLAGDPIIRADWKAYAVRLLTEPSSAPDCDAWKEEPAIIGLCPLNEDDPRFLGVPTEAYGDAYAWMLSVVRQTGYRGLVWGLNSGIDVSLMEPARLFDLEDFHVYWDHPQGLRYLNTSGVRQPWQFPNRMLPTLPLICTEWGSLPYNVFRGETGLLFAGEVAVRRASAAFSFALATNDEMMTTAKTPLDTFAFHTDPIRLATERAVVLLMRQPGTNATADWNRQAGEYRFESSTARISITGDNSARRADLFAALDRKTLTSSSRILLTRFGDALNTGFLSRLIADQVVFEVVTPGTLVVRELVPTSTYQFASNKNWEAWALDSYTGARLRRVECTEVAYNQWQVRPTTLNTELVAVSNSSSAF